MPVFIISGNAAAYHGDPHKHEPLSDPAALSMLHGAYSDDMCCEYLEDAGVQSLNLAGGRLRFEFSKETQSLRIVTAYEVSREPSDAERSHLVEQTVAQWSDGIGGGSFGNHRCEVLSATLAMALKNAGHDEIGEYFLDASPMALETDLKTEFSASGHWEDAVVADLIDGADTGDAHAMTMLGQRYERGEGVEQDGSRAFELYRQAAEQGNPLGLVLMGICYESGVGVEEDRAKAKEIYEQGVEMEFPLAMHCLGEMYEDEAPERSVELYRRGTDLGDLGCLAELGDCYEFGRGVEQDLDAALECYRQCMEYGFDAVEEAIQRIETSRN